MSRDIEVTAETPLLRNVAIPETISSTRLEKMTNPDGSLTSQILFPPHAFTHAYTSKPRRKLPQAIAHRGFKAKFPENTMGAFAGAIRAGAHAIETDLHLSKDGVVVISHDMTLERCFGRPEKIVDCDWSYLSTLQTLKEPHESMPRLKDVLDLLAKPGLEQVWLMLDIKVCVTRDGIAHWRNEYSLHVQMDNDPTTIIRNISTTISSVATSAPWQSRIVLGCWAAKYLPLCAHYLPGFPITHIGFSTSYARQFLSVPNVSFNMLLPILMAPGGRRFIKDVQGQQRPIFAWTVNEEKKMEWCIRKGLDGVITDDPELFLKVCERYDEGSKRQRLPVLMLLNVVRIWLSVLVLRILYRKRFDRVKDQRLILRGSSFGR
ncbi:hypothetical protein LTR28_006745 [Elasticomyces elasticus]|nr:hypothetical protein LTR28_006745 [Elasticomyces elasticus]